ncbi:glycosyltransferase [Spirillospora sp. CA-294931]|uniref:glycosyltransferase n=1 Tax=Spirillospora sp. CA-294931 TaxID=3240042 RepID=UPI003D8DA1C2
MTDPRVIAVVVTYNRRDLLTEALDALRAQTRPLDAVIVVDNASTDGTPALLEEHYGEVDLVELAHNTGGAGGFAAGLASALDAKPDLIWLMDDDTVPEPDALARLLDAHATTSATLVASRVVWTDGRDHPMNTPRQKPRATKAELARAAEAGCVPIRSASFVSILIEARAVEERGLPIADYFLWNDDFEFTTRLLRGRLGVLCPSSRVVHKTKTFGSTDADPGERFYYEVRNKVWLFTRSKGLSPAERVLYSGSTARRWARTFARSQDRATLRKGLRKGLSEALRHPPRPNEDVLPPQ